MTEKMADALRGPSQCKACGGILHYSPKTGNLKCIYCESEEKIEKPAPARPRIYNADSETGFVDWDSSLTTYKCSACGAVTELDKYETAPVCPFCDAPNLIKAEDSKGLRPSGILPFTIDKSDAIIAYKKWVKKRIFAPSKLKKDFAANKMKGIYIPCFTFSTETHSSYSGVFGKKYTVVVGSGKNRRTEVRIRYFPVSGTHSDLFSDLIYEVSSKITQKDLRKIRFFDIASAVEYSEDFLPGFSQERYTESLDDTFHKAEKDMDEAIRRRIFSKYDADVIQSLDVKTSYHNPSYKYIMSPVWECHYAFNKKDYRMIVNGRSGEIAGKTPVSPVRAAVAFLLGAGVLALIIWLASLFMGQ